MKFMLKESGEIIVAERVANRWAIDLERFNLNGSVADEFGELIAVSRDHHFFPLVNMANLTAEIEQTKTRFIHNMLVGYTIAYREVEGGIIYNTAYLKEGERYIKRLGRYIAFERLMSLGGCFVPRSMAHGFPL